MSNYMNEAFSALNLLEEDTFTVDVDGAAALKDFLDNDVHDDLELIIDPLAETEEELQDSYIGKVILDCTVCDSKIYKDAEEVVIDEEAGLANNGEECPFCHSVEGYKVIGQVTEFCPKCEESKIDAEDSVETEVDIEDKEDLKESTDIKDVNTRWLIDCKEEEFSIIRDLAKKYNLEPNKPEPNMWGGPYDWGISVTGKAKDIYSLLKEFADKAGENVVNENEFYDTIKYSLKDDSLDESKKSLDDIDADADNKKELAKRKFAKAKDDADSDRDYKLKKDIKEDLERIAIETDSDKITITSEEREENDDDKEEEVEEEKSESVEEAQPETIEPVSVETEDKFQDIDLDEFDETEFDYLGESYLKKVYENVKSYKTSKASIAGNKLKLEGIITFKSGKQGTTNFVFEAKTVTKTGKLKFLGENKQFARGKNAFTLTGKTEGKKLCCESLVYNYRAKDGKTGKSVRKYGRISK